MGKARKEVGGRMEGDGRREKEEGRRKRYMGREGKKTLTANLGGGMSRQKENGAEGGEEWEGKRGRKGHGAGQGQG